MANFSHEELTAEIYAVLKASPHGNDLEVAKRCAWEILRAQAARAQPSTEDNEG